MVSIKAQSTGPDGKLYAAGIGVGVENTPEGMQSQVLFLADRFAFINLVNSVITTPFVIQNGQTIINEAIIGNASIGSAKFKDWAESDALTPGGQRVLRINWRSGVIEQNTPLPGGGTLRSNGQNIIVFDPNGVDRVTVGYIP